VTTEYDTERLHMRPWGNDDVERLFDMYSRWEVARWLGSVPHPLESLDEATAVVQRWSARATPDGRFGIWAVEVKETGVIAGTVLLVPIPLTGEDAGRLPEDGGDIEVGWHFHPDSWGNGYATESARWAIDKALREGLEEVVAVVRPDNTASLAVTKRLSMEPMGLTERWYGVALESFRTRRSA
jgi:RimJ/RimL family protein N-acetyltransferase